jgi:hypothetical protein
MGLLTACSAATPEASPLSGEVTPIRLLPSLASDGINAKPATRTAITGTTFPVNATLGACVINASAPTPGVPHMTGYDNVRGIFENGAWGWYVSNIYAGPILAGFSSNSALLNIYGYAPYNAAADFDPGTQTLTVPFEIGNTDATASKDYMVARPVMNFDFSAPAALEFQHVMTCLRFAFRREYLKNGGAAPVLPPLYVKSIQLSLDDGAGIPVEKIGLKGSIVASKPFVSYGHAYTEPDKKALNVTDEESSLTVTYTNTEVPIQLRTATGSEDFPYNWLNCDIVIPELDASKLTARVTATLTFTDSDGTTDYVFDDGSTTSSIQFNLSDIACPDGAFPNGGLLRGYQYTYQCVVGTSVRYSTTPIVNKLASFTDGEVTVFPI